MIKILIKKFNLLQNFFLKFCNDNANKKIFKNFLKGILIGITSYLSRQEILKKKPKK